MGTSPVDPAPISGLLLSSLFQSRAEKWQGHSIHLQTSLQTETLAHITCQAILHKSCHKYVLYRKYQFCPQQDLLLPPANEVWGKVMFLHLSVCPQGEWGVMMSLPVMDSTPPPSGTAEPPPPGQHHPVNKRAVGILLECFFVLRHKVETNVQGSRIPNTMYKPLTIDTLPC